MFFGTHLHSDIISHPMEALALAPNTPGNQKIAIGSEALKASITGNQKIAVGATPVHAGSAMLDLVTTGNEKVAIGTRALVGNPQYRSVKQRPAKKNVALKQQLPTSSALLEKLPWQDAFVPAVLRMPEFFKNKDGVVVAQTCMLLRHKFCDHTMDCMREHLQSNPEQRSFGTGAYELWNDLQTSLEVAKLWERELLWRNPGQVYQANMLHGHLDLDGKRWVATGINPNFPWARYTEGQHFGKHKDTPTLRTDERGELTGARDKLTCLVYLNDNFHGGETVFYSNDGSELFRVMPQRGKAVVFDMDLLHEGLSVTGGDKFWLGCQIVMMQVK